MLECSLSMKVSLSNVAFLSFSVEQMPGVTVKDVNQQEFVCALSAFSQK
uniref:Uncharacterized protein n=1 Tax=Anguilla anguilla TaxID=7936 RepID=A0A0E9VTE8_ANGAN